MKQSIYNDLPDSISITEEGPREGFQIEPGQIATKDKLKLIQMLSDTGLKAIQVCSFVSPRIVPGWADADEMVAQLKKIDDIDYTALWFNARGLDRAVAHKEVLSLVGMIHTVASEAFCQSNLNRTREANHKAMIAQTHAHQAQGVDVSKISVMAAFGCNFSGDVSAQDALAAVDDGMSVASETGACIREIALADTMGWANPGHIDRVVRTVRDKYPDVPIRLHLHDTRGLGIANAMAGLHAGVQKFDSTVAGLGGCPFAASSEARKGATSSSLPPGNIATEELVLLAMEQGIHTGIDIDALIEAGHMAETIVGHALPSAALRGNSLSSYRRQVER